MRVSKPQYDDGKIEDAVLALLGAFEFEDGRVWKRYEFAVMEALHEKGLITNPHGHAESVYLTGEGMRRARQLARLLFAASPGDDQTPRNAAG